MGSDGAMKLDMEQPRRIFLSDYQPPDFLLTHTELTFHLWPDHTEVESRLSLSRAAYAATDAPLVLLGADLELLSVSWNGRELNADDYHWQGEQWLFRTTDARGELVTRVRIYPEQNKALEGLYRSHGMYCTQCEAEGFRKITLYPDRPDVLSTFRTTIHADRASYPILLANGNRVASSVGQDGRHWVTWDDPFPKPSYLFAMVAGDLSCCRDEFITQSGRRVALEIYTAAADQNKCAHAMDSLKQSMRWDEQRYGREYDLDVYMIVAVSHFNMGAMENKGLNIFNTSCVLAHPATTTDMGFQRVQSVVAHEYFHNWSGNRVTCRDWFQLCLKEGFTVFRDQQFTADQLSAAVQRLDDVAFLKTHQFAEDTGPLAHAVRPAAFVEINNFYTLTVYEKGAEIARALHTWLGEAAFRRGSDLYFARHDGQAVTVEDFLTAMADANDLPAAQFMRQWLRWYTQVGTPTVKINSHYDAAAQRLTLTLRQSQPEQTPAALPLPMPVRLGLIGQDGAMHFNHQGELATEHLLRFTEAEQTWQFDGVTREPVLSIFRDLSAPVRVEHAVSDRDLQALMASDDNGFNRWSASVELVTREMLLRAQRYRQGLNVDGSTQHFVDAIQSSWPALASQDLALAMKILQLPTLVYLADQVEVFDAPALYVARESLLRESYQAVAQTLQCILQAGHMQQPYVYNADAISQRAAAALALDALAYNDPVAAANLAQDWLTSAPHMTAEQAALMTLVHHQLPGFQDALAEFYQRWHHEALVLDQWFALQAAAPRVDTFAVVKNLLTHPDFHSDVPNRVRSVLAQFANNNPLAFHQEHGQGYALLAEQIALIDRANPQLASRLAGAFGVLRKLPPAQQALMAAEVDKLLAGELSADSRETLSRIQGNGAPQGL